MMRVKWLAAMIAVCALLVLPFSAMAEADGSDAINLSELDLNNIDILIDGVPLEELLEGLDCSNIEIVVDGVPLGNVLDTAGRLFADALEENVEVAIEGLNDVFTGFANDFSNDLGTIFGGAAEESWVLKIRDVELDKTAVRSAYDSALELYEAQMSGECDGNARIARDWTQGCANNIVYIYDDEGIIPAILGAVEDESLAYEDIVFSQEGLFGTYWPVSVSYIEPSDELCRMTEFEDEQQFEQFRSRVTEKAVKVYDEPLEYGDTVLTLVFWNEDADAQWLCLVAKEVPVLLE